MEAYRNHGRYRTENERIKLDIYLNLAPCGAQEMDCAKQLRDFAEDYNFELNIKVAALYQNNEEELCYLMTSEYCTVSSFTKDDYKHLTEYLSFLKEWKYTQDIIKRDEETQLKLTKIKYGEYDSINI